MNLLLNIIWLILGGFIVVISYLLGGIVLCLTIIGIPCCCWRSRLLACLWLCST